MADQDFDALLWYIKQPPDPSGGGAFKPGNATKLKLYGYFKQAKDGDNTTAQPGMWSVEARAKWGAWDAVRGLSAAEAKSSYVLAVEAMVGTGWRTRAAALGCPHMPAEEKAPPSEPSHPSPVDAVSTPSSSATEASSTWQHITVEELDQKDVAGGEPEDLAPQPAEEHEPAELSPQSSEAEKPAESAAPQFTESGEQPEATPQATPPAPTSPSAAASAAGGGQGISLTAAERRAFLTHGVISFITELTFGLNSASMNLKLLQLSGGDMAKIATAHAWHWCCNAVLKNFTTPLFSALSDSFGRVPFWAVGRFSYFTYFLGLHLCQNLPQFSFVMVFGQCIMPAAASLTVQAAAWSDIFGSRPTLSGNLQARTQVWTSAAGLIGPVIGGLLAARSRSAAFFVCMGLCIAQTAVVWACDESLPPAQRRQFVLGNAVNPVGGLSLLFTHGPGLRRLALAAACFESTSHVYATMDTFRMGPIGLGPSEQSYFSALLSGVNMLTTTFIARPMLQTLGPRRSFEQGSLVAAVAYVCLSLSCRPAGATHWQLVAQFCLAKMVLMTPWSEPARFALLPMVVKQGQAVTPAGQGEINAAFQSVTSITQIFMPACWVWLFNVSYRQTQHGGWVGSIFGPGAHFLVAALIRLLGRQLLRGTRDADLFLDDATSCSVAARNDKKKPAGEPDADKGREADSEIANLSVASVPGKADEGERSVSPIAG